MPRSTAYNLIRQQPHYRREAFTAGLMAVGFHVVVGSCGPAKPGDVLVIWNRYGHLEQQADRFEAQGGTVLVAENAYLGADRDNRQIYALARHAHNGRGQWFPGGPERFQQLGIDLQPMRAGGDYALIAPNRSFGMQGGVMPAEWADRLARQLRDRGESIRIRLHPGNGPALVPLEQDLAGASRVEIWSSSVGVAALVAGIPVVSHAPWWICKGWEQRGREAVLNDLAWAQWTVEDIADGTAFRHLLRSGHLLRPEREAQIAASA